MTNKIKAPSRFDLYGGENVVKKKFEERYNEIAVGCGKRNEDPRLVNIFVFYNSNGKIATYENWKIYKTDFDVSRRGLSENKYNLKSFNKFCLNHNINLTKKFNLEKVIKELNTKNNFSSQ